MVEKKPERIESANIHITDDCNYRCSFCFSRGTCRGNIIRLQSWKPIIYDLVCNRGIRKINFAGGEPMLHPDIMECLRYSKQLGATTSLVTNGSLIKPGFLKECASYLNWIGMSIDSTDEETEIRLGRHCRDGNHLEKVLDISKEARNLGIHVKLNITVTRQCLDDDFHDIIKKVNPDRIKFLQVTRIPGVNDSGYMSTSVSEEQFNNMIKRHMDVELEYGFRPVFEKSEDIIDSYLMLDCLGRVRIGSAEGYDYVDYDEYWNGNRMVNLDAYIRRGGMYDWELKGEIM